MMFGFEKGTTQVSLSMPPADVTDIAADSTQAGPRPQPIWERILRRTGRAVIVAFWVMVVAFMLIRLAPGDPVSAALGGEASPETVAALRTQLGLDVDPITQFWNYLWALTQGDLGSSLLSGVPVTEMLKTNLPVTLWLIAITVTMTMIVSIPLAVFIALVRIPALPYVFRTLTAIGLALPSFLVALLLLYQFGLIWGIAPIFGYEPGFPANLHYLWLPALVNCVVLVPVLSRVLYSSILDTLDEEFVETGVIRGVKSYRFFWFYVLRPSLAPTVVLLSYMMGVMVGSTVILESIFALPGIGRELVTAVSMRDYPVVQGIILVFGVLVVFLSLLGDIVASLLDPRVKLT